MSPDEISILRWANACLPEDGPKIERWKAIALGGDCQSLIRG